MPKKVLSSIVAGALVLFSASPAWPADGPAVGKVEVPIGNVFVPAQGYTEGDVVEVVLDGVLPDHCYVAPTPQLTLDTSSRKIEAHLLASHRVDGDCADERQLPPGERAPVPYTLVVPLGHLAEGDYQVVYPRPGLPDGISEFQVGSWKSASGDDPSYATVTSVRVRKLVRGDVGVEVMIAGYLDSSCDSLQSPVTAQQEGDVFVISPALAPAAAGGVCAIGKAPFRQRVSLGKLSEGRYLVHVRSAEGRSIDRAFTVVVPDPT